MSERRLSAFPALRSFFWSSSAHSSSQTTSHRCNDSKAHFIRVYGRCSSFLLRADRYAGILESGWWFCGFSQSTVRRSSSAFRASFLQDAGMRGGVLLPARANSSRPAIIAAPPAMITSVVLGGIKPRISVPERTQRQQEHAINAVAHRPPFARRAFRGVRSDARSIAFHIAGQRRRLSASKRWCSSSAVSLSTAGSS